MRTTVVAAAIAACVAAGCAGNKARQDPPPPPVAAEPMELTLSGDALFAFGKADIDDLSGDGRAQLDAFASRLGAAPFELVRITGHSDRIGSEKANMALSKRRAESVRDYLAQRGIAAEKIIATGLGPYRPVVPCDGESGQALIDCLAPNRRVEITVVPALAR